MKSRPVLALIAVCAAACGGSPPPREPVPPLAPGAAAPTPEAPKVRNVTLESVGLDGAALDRAADPCNDFYQFACGGWIQKTEIPGDKPRWVRSFNEIDDRNELALRAILDKAAGAAGGDPIAKQIGDYWTACMDEAAVEKAGTTAIRPLLQRVAKLDSTKQIADVVIELHRHAIWALFDVDSEQDMKDATRMIAQIDQNGLGLPDRDYYVKQDDKSKELRQKYQAHVERMLGLAGWKTADARRAAEDVMRIETALAKVSLTRVERRDPEKLYNKLGIEGLNKQAWQFPWSRYFEALGLPATNLEVNMTSPAFVLGMGALFDREKLPAFRNYLSWHVVRASARSLPKAFVDESFAMEQALTGQKELAARWKRCIDATDQALGEALAQAFVAAHFAGDSKTAAERYVHEISAAFAAGAEQLDWMDPDTRARALGKREAMQYLIGYPERWKDYGFEVRRDDHAGNVLRARAFDRKRELAKIGKPVDRNEWQMSPPTVNAYYDPQRNHMVFPAGILQPPFYSVKASVAVNLGAMGMVVGHELTHGFDDEGSKFDGSGNLSGWWGPEVRARFEQKTHCVRDQYAAYEALPGVRLDGKLTLGENIADLGGIKLAFRAYRAMRAGASEVDSAEGFSEDQQFFLATGQIWCARYREEYARMAAQIDPHSPPRWRVNGPMSNLPEFAEAFACKPGSTMNPEQKCAVW